MTTIGFPSPQTQAADGGFDLRASLVHASLPAQHRVLTVYQPWASLLVGGVKRFETRPIRANYRGLLFIHAGKHLGDNGRLLTYQLAAEFREMGVDVAGDAWADELPLGAIVGAIRLCDCQPTVELLEDGRVSDREQRLGDYAPERFGWHVEHPVRFKTPVPIRGRQGLRFLPVDVLDAAECELRRCATGEQWDGLMQDVGKRPAAGG
jgi:activating signal cointegrator 1